MDDRQREPWYSDPAPWTFAGLAVVLRLLWVTFGTRVPTSTAERATYLYPSVRVPCGRGAGVLLEMPCVVSARTSYYPPGYSLFLGAQQRVLTLVGMEAHTTGVTVVVQSLLAGAAVLAVFVVGRRLGGRAVGAAAAFVLAVWPDMVVRSGLPHSETLFVAVFGVSLAAVLTMQDRARWHWFRAVLAGASFGLACSLRPQALLAVPALALAWAFSSAGWRRVLGRSAVMVVGVLLVSASLAVVDRHQLADFFSFAASGEQVRVVGTTTRHVLDLVWGFVVAAAVLGLGITAVRGWGRRRLDPTGLCVVLVTLACAVVPLLFVDSHGVGLGMAPLLAVLTGVTLTVGRRWPEPVEHLAPEPDAADLLELAALTGQLPVVVAGGAAPVPGAGEPSGAVRGGQRP